MSVVDDVRRVVQDMVAPDLKSLHVELKAAEEAAKLRELAVMAELKSVDNASKLRDDAILAELKSVDNASKLRDDAILAELKSVDNASKLRDDALADKIDSLGEKVDAKFQLVLAKMEANHAALIYSMNIEKRVEAIEKKTAATM